VAQGVGLTLRNGNTTLSSGSTDASGVAYFNTTYFHIWRLDVGTWANDNSTSTLTLTARLGDELQVNNVSAYSSSPIVFRFEKAPEPPIWGNRYALLIAGGLMIMITLAYIFLKRKWKVVDLQQV
jgi:hypothetical protein